MPKRILSSQIMVPITAGRPTAVTSESVAVPAGAAGSFVNFYFARKPILDSHHSWIGGFGDTSITGVATVFTTEVPAYTPDASMSNGEYWVDYVSGVGRGKKATTGTSLTVSYYVSVSAGDLSNGGTINGDLTVNGDFTTTGAFSIGSLVSDTIILDADNAETFLVRKNGDAGDVFMIDTINSQSKFANGTNLLPSISFITDTDTGLFRKGANNIGFAIGATEVGDLSATNLTLATRVAFSAGVAVTAAAYSVGRDADATNQLHFNVPTGAGYEWSVNDAAIVTLTSTALATSTTLAIGSTLTYTSAATVTAAAIQIFRDQTATPNFLGFNVPTNSGFSFYVNGVIESYQSATGLIQMSGNNYKLFNTSDIVTNTESVTLDWNANIARLYTFPTGSGSARSLSISALNASSGGGTITLGTAAAFIALSHSNSAGTGSLMTASGTSTASSGVASSFAIAPTITQTSTAGHNSLLVNPTESTIGSGTRNLASLQVGSTERFGFRNDGDYVQTQKVRTTGLPVGFTFTGAAHTGVANSIYRDFYLNLNRSVSFAGGGASIQYAAGFEVTPISFAAASAQSISIITASMFTGGAIAGSNITATYQATRYAVFGTGKSANLVTDALLMPGIDNGVGAMTSIHGYAVHAGFSNVSLGNQTATLDRLSAFYNEAITYESATNTRTVTEAAGAYFNAPIAGTNVSFTAVYGAIIKTGSFKISAGRLATAKGADVASANDLTLGSDGNSFTITGTKPINAIRFAGWVGGAPVILYFTGATTVKHNTAGGAGTAPILLSGSADLVTAANTVLVLSYDGTNWQELSRKTA